MVPLITSFIWDQWLPHFCGKDFQNIVFITLTICWFPTSSRLLTCKTNYWRKAKWLKSGPQCCCLLFYDWNKAYTQFLWKVRTVFLWRCLWLCVFNDHTDCLKYVIYLLKMISLLKKAVSLLNVRVLSVVLFRYTYKPWYSGVGVLLRSRYTGSVTCDKETATWLLYISSHTCALKQGSQPDREKEGDHGATMLCDGLLHQLQGVSTWVVGSGGQWGAEWSQTSMSM